ncbi:unnamed protein product [Arabis nemorensis]|uniref:Uncharacterized protein n=1 Tax=Arabis nemorensis TaxID=586526 RepID=A0A565C9E8_9BRAS|nr:unnamed protein product [Arabis nemorensis]
MPPQLRVPSLEWGGCTSSPTRSIRATASRPTGPRRVSCTTSGSRKDQFGPRARVPKPTDPATVVGTRRPGCTKK